MPVLKIGCLELRRCFGKGANSLMNVSFDSVALFPQRSMSTVARLSINSYRGITP